MSLNSSNYSKRTYKIVLLGDSNVGKTCLIERFISNKFQHKENSTVGIDFVGKNVLHNNKTYRLQLWDTAGQERYRSLIPSYLKDALCAIFVYDVANKQSLENLQEWIKLFRENKSDKTLMVICGNKNDLEQAYDPKSLTHLVTKYKLKDFLVSALSGNNVDSMFKQIIDMLADEQIRKKKKKLEDSGIIIPPQSSSQFNLQLSSEMQFGQKHEQQMMKSQKQSKVVLDKQSTETQKKCQC